MTSNGTLNRVALLGHLGADPESRFTASGVAVTNFRVATNHRYRTADGEEHTETDWTPVVTWRGLAEVCNTSLRKGSRVYVEGRLKTRAWQDDTGATRYRTAVEAASVIFLDGRGQMPAPDETPEEEPLDVVG